MFPAADHTLFRPGYVGLRAVAFRAISDLVDGLARRIADNPPDGVGVKCYFGSFQHGASIARLSVGIIPAV
jgi:hypothetical protein